MLFGTSTGGSHTLHGHDHMENRQADDGGMERTSTLAFIECTCLQPGFKSHDSHCFPSGALIKCPLLLAHNSFPHDHISHVASSKLLIPSSRNLCCDLGKITAIGFRLINDEIDECKSVVKCSWSTFQTDHTQQGGSSWNYSKHTHSHTRCLCLFFQTL